jgi:hypothetical protein
MLAVLLLRRIAYTMLALFRSVTLRSDASSAMRWKALLAWVRDALVAATYARVHHEPTLPPARSAPPHSDLPGSHRRRRHRRGEGTEIETAGASQRWLPPARTLSETRRRRQKPDVGKCRFSLTDQT